MRHGQEANYLIALLRSGISEVEPETPNILLNWEWVHEIASRHKISYFAYNGILKLPKGKKPSEEILNYFIDDIEEAKRRDKMQTEEVDRLLVFFKKEQISVTLLQDWPMKELYELSEMREITTIQILLNVPIDEKIDSFMSSLGYDMIHKGIASTIYSNDPLIQVRLYSYLFWNEENLKQYFEDTWSRLEVIEEQEYIYRFSLEDFYILYIANLWKQCKEARVDIRPFLDLWLYIEHYIEELNWEYIQGEMEKLSLTIFHYRVMQLVEYWFGEEKEIESIVEKLGEFVLQSGNSRGEQAKMLIGIAEKLEEGDIDRAKKAYIRERIFLAKEEMKENYKTLQKKPYLLPAYHVKRLSKGVFRDLRKTMKEYHKIQRMKKNDIKQMASLIEQIGLKNK